MKRMLTEIIALSFLSFAGAKDELRLLALVPLTGKEPANGKACAAALQLVVDEANKQSNFLDTYNIKLVVEDEARNANNAPEALFRFLGSQSDLPNGTYLSPVVIGPSITCQYVTFAARFVHITQFSQFCAGPILAMRDFLPNLYRVQMPGEYSVIAMMMFIKHIGFWRQISIFTYSLNVNEYTMAKKLDQMATENGIEVLHYSSEADITFEMVQDVQALGARVITMIYLQVAMCAKILCYSHMAGMRAPRYIFIGLVYCSFSPETLINLPKGCTKEMVQEQLKVTFWVGPSPLAVGNNGPTTFGYDLDDFEMSLNRRLENTIASDMDQRHLCHDTALAALMTLNNSDQSLKDRYDSSLREFANNPIKVATVVNESAGNVSYHGLRIGQIQYSARLELSKEDIWIMEFTDYSIRWLHKVAWFDDGLPETKNQLYNTSRYVFQANQPIFWQTHNRKPPKDLSFREMRYEQYPFEVMVVLSVISSIGATKNLAFLAVISKKSEATHLHVVTNVMLLTGCTLINIAVVFIQTGAVYLVSKLYCQMRVVLATFSLALVNAVVCGRMLVIVKAIQLNKKARPVHTRSSWRARIVIPPLIEASLWKRWDLGVAVFGLVCAVISLAISLAWMISDMELVVQVSEVQFDQAADVYFKAAHSYCGSAYTLPWGAALLLPHFMLVLGAAFVACFMMKKSQITRRQVELQMCKVAALNTLTLFCATLLIAVIISDENVRTVVLSVILVVFAESVMITWSRPVWQSANQANASATNSSRGVSTFQFSYNTISVFRRNYQASQVDGSQRRA